ncbi:MAG: NifB/NifX family molybdenum-iron cluster-binding protein [Candidatus Margulisiibacteriota bacterium]
MKICIPIKSNEGKLSKVFDHFGSAPQFMIYDISNNSIKILDNGNKDHIHGTCNPMNALDLRTIDAVVCRGMGARAILKLNEAGVKAYKTEAETAEQVVLACRENKLEEITLKTACTQHDCH